MQATNRRRTLPQLSPTAPTELRPLLQAMKEILETGEGVRGDSLDRKLTYRDLVSNGMIKLRVPGNPDGGIDIIVPDTPPDMTVPPKPTGFSAQGSFFGMINLSWDMPHGTYGNHGYTNIYRSETDNFGQAILIGQEGAGGFYTDVVRQDAPAPTNPDEPSEPVPLKGYYYWITFASESDVEGPLNSSAGTYAIPLPDARYLLEQLSGQLGESELEQALRDRLEGIEWSQTAIEEQSKVVQGLSAQYTLKLNVNGYISGFGAYNNGSVADFAILADRFWIARPGVPSSAVKPFMVVNGKVYIDSAFIREASIQEGQLGPITFGKIFDKAGLPVTSVAGKLKADHIEVDELFAAYLNAKKAFIDTAHIKDAAIDRAHIKDLAVDTLKIADEAVLIPRAANGFYFAQITMVSPVITKVVLIGTFAQGLGRQSKPVSLYMIAPSGETVIVATETPIQATTGAMAVVVQIPANQEYTFKIGAHEHVGDMRCAITVLGVKR